MLNLTPYILLFPLLGFTALGLFGRGLPRWLISWIGCGTVLVSAALAVADLASLLATPAHRVSEISLWSWTASGALSINFDLLSDPLSSVMLLVVTGVGFLIHLYSVGYMEDDPGYWRYFSFLNLFIFTMALLVAAGNFLFLLIGWAGVGLASFLLIGFWYTRPSAVAAAQKAFVVNVIGDLGLTLAIFLLFNRFGSLVYRDILFGGAQSPAAGLALNSPEVVAITLLLFVAAAAKSAQFPLHVWLPDAMEGPTPVSALIHAATMVTAGVYLVARAAPLFERASVSLAIVAGIGGFSALFAATIACVQHDIKRVLAYSTISQLGYMFLGEGAGGYTAGIFHLTTHAFFKALLFMAAGAVIHALGGEQDMRKMGGLRTRLPSAFWGFLAGGLALAAIVPFAGFWSKDAILGAVLQRAQSAGASPWWYLLYVVGLVTAVLTGFYIFRLIFLVFAGSYRGGEIAPTYAVAPTTSALPRAGNGVGQRTGANSLGHLHQVGWVMTAPMWILAALSLVGGFDGIPGSDALGDMLAPVTAAPYGLPPGSLAFWASIGLSLACAVLGVALAITVYGRRQPRFAAAPRPLSRFIASGYALDAVYDRVIVRPVLWLGRATGTALEGLALDGGSRGLGWVLGRTSAGLRLLQTGYVRTYALGIVLGAAAILLYFMLRL